MTEIPLKKHSVSRETTRQLFDRLPTTWLVTAVAAVLLGVSAVFGGLDEAPVEAAAVIEAGDTHAGSELTLTVDQALLIDAFPEQLVIPQKGNRLLVVRAVVENTTNEPRRLSTVPLTSSGAPRPQRTVQADVLRIVGVSGQRAATPPTSILVIDDGSDKVVVQPHVPVELAFVWEVPQDEVKKGDTINVQLLDRVLISEGELTYGGLYGDPVVTASLELVLGDVGAGVSE